MLNSTAKTAARVLVDVSADRLAAHIRLSDAGVAMGLSAAEVLDVLRKAKIKIDDEVLGRVAEFVQLATSPGGPSGPFLAAQGKLPTDGQDADFEWSARFRREVQTGTDGTMIDPFKVSKVVTVESGEVLGTLRPATSGQAGYDVYGSALLPRRHPSEVALDNGVIQSADDPTVVLATVAGRVVYSKMRLSIVQVLEFRGDIDFETGSIDSSVDVHIAGTIRGGFEVKSAKSITVGGAIEDARVEARGDVVVRGGILGQQKGGVKAEGNIVAKYCDRAKLHADGTVSIHKEVFGSDIYAGGRLIGPHTTVVGGCLYARDGIEVATLGSDSGVATAVIVGIHPDILREIKRLEREVAARTAAVARIRGTIQPLLACQKQLTPAQKERATELLYEADTMEAGLSELQNRRQELLARGQPSGAPAVLVANMVYPNVNIRIGSHRAEVRTVLKGPVQIENRKVEDALACVAVNQLTGSVTPLPTREVQEVDRSDETPATGKESMTHGPGH